MRQQRMSAGSAKKAVSQKISRAQKGSLFAFSKLDYGVYPRGLCVVFRIRPAGEICFCFFNAACRAVPEDSFILATDHGFAGTFTPR
jgi:hypothetical protein